jgi:signal transduction histidine kinase
MRERLEMVGGKFGIESAPGKGTTITAQIQTGDGKKVRAKPASTALLRTTL